MNQIAKIELPVEPATAAALTDPRRLAAIGHLVDRLVRPGATDRLVALLDVPLPKPKPPASRNRTSKPNSPPTTPSVAPEHRHRRKHRLWTAKRKMADIVARIPTMAAA